MFIAILDYLPYTYIYVYICTYRLDDFDNACAAYEKSLTLADEHITRLNYAITLYKNDEVEKSKLQYILFEKCLELYMTGGTGEKGHNSDPLPEIDNEILLQSEALRELIYGSEIDNDF